MATKKCEHCGSTEAVKAHVFNEDQPEITQTEDLCKTCRDTHAEHTEDRLQEIADESGLTLSNGVHVPPEPEYPDAVEGENPDAE